MSIWFEPGTATSVSKGKTLHSLFPYGVKFLAVIYVESNSYDVGFYFQK